MQFFYEITLIILIIYYILKYNRILLWERDYLKEILDM